MSVKVMAEVWALDLPVGEMIVLLALADHAHDDGSKCFPGVNYLAWKTCTDRRSVQRNLRRLESKHLILPVSSMLGGRGHATEYRIFTRKGVTKSPFVRDERAAPLHERAASRTQRAVLAPPQPSVTISNHQRNAI